MSLKYYLDDDGKIRLLTSGIEEPELYEQNTHVTDWTGIWASDQTGDIEYVKIGKVVTITIPETIAVANAAALITIVTVLPEHLRPDITLTSGWHVHDNAVNLDGYIEIKTDGTITFATDETVANFSGAGNSGFRGWSTTFITSA